MGNNIFGACSTRASHCLVTVVLKVAMTTWNGLIPPTAGTASQENTDATHLVLRAGSIGTDSVRRALAGALVSFAHQSGARVVAEGIETAHELAAAADLGIDYGQGFYLGRPEHGDDLFSVLSTSQRSWRTAR